MISMRSVLITALGVVTLALLAPSANAVSVKASFTGVIGASNEECQALVCSDEQSGFGISASNNGLSGFEYILSFFYGDEPIGGVGNILTKATMEIAGRVVTFLAPSAGGSSFNPGPVYINENYSMIFYNSSYQTDDSEGEAGILAWVYGTYGDPPRVPLDPYTPFSPVSVDPTDWYSTYYFAEFSTDASGHRTMVHYLDLQLQPGTFEVTSTVSVPAALPLLLSGLTLMGFYGWRKSRQSSEKQKKLRN